MTFRSCLSALVLLLFCERARAQAGPVWPTNAATGRIEFTGVLAWPAPAPAQQRALVRRWYAANLTSARPERVAPVDTTFGGVARAAYLDSVSYGERAGQAGAVDSLYDWSIWRLLYQVDLTPTATGLVYRLSGFECREIVYDTSTGASLEEVLAQTPTSRMMAWHLRHLRGALANWQGQPPAPVFVPARPRPRPPCTSLAPVARPVRGSTVVGTWTLQTVRHHTQPADGAPAWCEDMNLGPELCRMTLTTDRRVVWRENGRRKDTGTYAFFGDSLNLYDRQRVFRGRIGELSATRLVVLTQFETPDGPLHVIATHVRTPPRRQPRPR